MLGNQRALSSVPGSITVLSEAGQLERVRAHVSEDAIARLATEPTSSALLIPCPRVWTERQLLSLAEALGGVSVSARNPEPVRTIVPIPRELAPRNTLSSRHGTCAFPLHTDGAHWQEPPRFLILQCVEVGDGDRPTRLLPPVWLTSSLQRCLSGEPWIVNDRRRAFLCSPVDKAQRRIRYDAACMRPAATTLDRVELATRNAPAVSLTWRPGDILIIDNWRCLHARAASAKQGRERVLKRVLVGGRQRWQ